MFNQRSVDKLREAVQYAERMRATANTPASIPVINAPPSLLCIIDGGIDTNGLYPGRIARFQGDDGEYVFSEDTFRFRPINTSDSLTPNRYYSCRPSYRDDSGTVYDVTFTSGPSSIDYVSSLCVRYAPGTSNTIVGLDEIHTVKGAGGTIETYRVPITSCPEVGTGTIADCDGICFSITLTGAGSSSPLFTAMTRFNRTWSLAQGSATACGWSETLSVNSTTTLTVAFDKCPGSDTATVTLTFVNEYGTYTRSYVLSSTLDCVLNSIINFNPLPNLCYTGTGSADVDDLPRIWPTSVIARPVGCDDTPDCRPPTTYFCTTIDTFTDPDFARFNGYHAFFPTQVGAYPNCCATLVFHVDTACRERKFIVYEQRVNNNGTCDEMVEGGTYYFDYKSSTGFVGTYPSTLVLSNCTGTGTGTSYCPFDNSQSFCVSVEITGGSILTPFTSEYTGKYILAKDTDCTWTGPSSCATYSVAAAILYPDTSPPSLRFVGPGVPPGGTAALYTMSSGSSMTTGSNTFTLTGGSLSNLFPPTVTVSGGTGCATVVCTPICSCDTSRIYCIDLSGYLSSTCNFLANLYTVTYGFTDPETGYCQWNPTSSPGPLLIITSETTASVLVRGSNPLDQYGMYECNSWDCAIGGTFTLVDAEDCTSLPTTLSVTVGECVTTGSGS